MKAHTHYTTPVATVAWSRRGKAAMLVLAAAVGLAFALWLASQPIHTTTSGATARPEHSLIAHCRVCADEVLGAAQATKAGLPVQLTLGSSAGPRIAGSRVIQDEVLGADQANLAFLSLDAARRASQAAAAAAPTIYQHIAGPRAFRDEVLGADQANLASLTIHGNAFEQQHNDLRRAGPR